MINFRVAFYAVIFGILPAIVWLFFWRSEDSKKPEPKGLIIRTFLFGAIAVPLVIPFQKMVLAHYPGLGFMTFFLWAVLEELFKFVAGWVGGLQTPDDDEPLDPLIYMLTAALGFVALENTLFILNPLLQANLNGTVITGSLRFIGSSLLHTVSSGAIGLALALSFYKRPWKRFLAGLLAFAFAIFSHTAFNLFILGRDSMSTFYTFSVVWAGIAALLYSFEKVKTIKPTVLQ